MYDTTKPVTRQIVELVRQTWHTDYVDVEDWIVYKKFIYPERHHVDGSGTKYECHHTPEIMVHDAFAMNANDVAIRGGRPYALTNHIFSETDDEEYILRAVKRLVDICIEYNIAITDGETAIHNTMSGMEMSIAMLAFIEKPKKNLFEIGDILIGIKSAGLHANGFTRIRELFIDLNRPEFALPTPVYMNAVLELNARLDVHGMMHITGGAFTKLKDVLPNNANVLISSNHSLEPQEIFWELVDRGVSDKELYRTFPCGIGFVIGVPTPQQAHDCISILRKHGFESDIIGGVYLGIQQIIIRSKFSRAILTY